MLQQCRRALKPDGLFLAAMLGGDTLHELRVSCNLAEEELQGGVSQRVSPLAQVQKHPAKLLHEICCFWLQQVRFSLLCSTYCCQRVCMYGFNNVSNACTHPSGSMPCAGADIIRSYVVCAHAALCSSDCNFRNPAWTNATLSTQQSVEGAS